jgi:hypothetical protein
MCHSTRWTWTTLPPAAPSAVSLRGR